MIGVRVVGVGMMQSEVGGDGISDLTQPRRDLIENRPRPPDGNILHEPRDARSRLPFDKARIGRQASHDQLHQRGLAGPVTTEQPDPLAPLDLQIDMIQQRRADKP